MMIIECKYCHKKFAWKDSTRQVCVQCERLGLEDEGDEVA